MGSRAEKRLWTLKAAFRREDGCLYHNTSLAEKESRYPAQPSPFLLSILSHQPLELRISLAHADYQSLSTHSDHLQRIMDSPATTSATSSATLSATSTATSNHETGVQLERPINKYASNQTSKSFPLTVTDTSDQRISSK